MADFPISSRPWYILFLLARIPFTSFSSELKYHLSSCCQSQTHLSLRYYWFYRLCMTPSYTEL